MADPDLNLPVVLAFARGPILRWFWVPAALFALALGIGPHMSTTQDDLLPMVRFLGAMQTLLAMGIGASIVICGAYLWKASAQSSAVYALRTLLAVGAFLLLALVGWPGGAALQARVHTMPEWPQQHHDELMQIANKLESLPPARKQAGPGTENHWWNLLTYVYGRTPSLLQMGGGGLQSSPNYDFLWSGRDATKNAWIYPRSSPEQKELAPPCRSASMNRFRFAKLVLGAGLATCACGSAPHGGGGSAGCLRARRALRPRPACRPRLDQPADDRGGASGRGRGEHGTEVDKPVKPMTEGPLHEAFLSPAKDRDPLHVASRPPPPLVERPGVDPPDPNVQWIEGYWEWDKGRRTSSG